MSVPTPAGHGPETAAPWLQVRSALLVGSMSAVREVAGLLAEALRCSTTRATYNQLLLTVQNALRDMPLGAIIRILPVLLHEDGQATLLLLHAAANATMDRHRINSGDCLRCIELLASNEIPASIFCTFVKLFEGGWPEDVILDDRHSDLLQGFLEVQLHTDSAVLISVISALKRLPMLKPVPETTMEHIFDKCVASGHISAAEANIDHIFFGVAKLRAWEKIRAEAERRGRRTIAARATERIQALTAVGVLTTQQGIDSADAAIGCRPPDDAESLASKMAGIIARKPLDAPRIQSSVHSTPASSEQWRRSIRLLLTRGDTDQAFIYVGSSLEMQLFMVEELLVLGKPATAEEVFIRLFKLRHQGSFAGEEAPPAAPMGIEGNDAEPLEAFRLGGKLSLRRDIRACSTGLSYNRLMPDSWNWPLSHSNISGTHAGLHVVDSPDQVLEMIQFFSQRSWWLPSAFIGVDAEWRPDTPGLAKRWPVSVLQVAHVTQAFVVDLLLLNQCRESVGGAQRDSLDKLVQKLFLCIFCEPALIKTGFGISQDLARIATSYPWWARCLASSRSIIDLGHLATITAHHLHGRAASGPFSAPIAAQSLSSLTQRLLGQPLDKRQQTSDWQRRPLQESQLRYAALDAVVGSVVCHYCWYALEALFGADWALEIVHSEVDGEALELANMHLTADAYLPANDGISERSSSTCPTEVAAVLVAHGLDPTNIVVHVDEGRSAGDGAAALGVPVQQIVKTLAFLTKDTVPLIVLMRGSDKVDTGKLAALLDYPRHSVRLASADECKETFGYVPGTFPPIAHRGQFTTYVDARITETLGPVFTGAGTVNLMMRLDAELLLRLTGGVVVDLAVGEPVRSTPSIATPLSASSISDLSPKLLVDSMLGRLMRWLRVIGVDAESPHGLGANEFLASVGESTMNPRLLCQWVNASGRIFVTRDRRVLKQNLQCPLFFLPFNDTIQQFEYIAKHFDLRVRQEDLMSRCSKCNGLGYDLVDVDGARALGGVPAKVLATITEYWRCKRCSKLYWEGPKFSDVQSRFAALVQDPDDCAGTDDVAASEHPC